MTIHILLNAHFAVVRCHTSDEKRFRTALGENGFECGRTREVLDMPSLVDINIKRDGSWENINAGELRDLATKAGLEVAGE